MKEQIMSFGFRLCDNTFCTHFQNAHPSSAFTLLLQLNLSFGDILAVVDLQLTEPGSTLQGFSKY